MRGASAVQHKRAMSRWYRFIRYLTGRRSAYEGSREEFERRTGLRRDRES